MSQPERPSRVKVCGNCREFIVLFPYLEENERLEVKFDEIHKGHMVSILSIREIDIDNYVAGVIDGTLWV